MDVDYDGQTAFDAAANGDFPLVVLLWGMAMAVQPKPVDLLAAKDQSGNTLVHYAAASGEDTCDTMHFLMQQMHASGREQLLMDAKNDAGETPLMRASHAGNMRLADTLLRSGYVDLLAHDVRGNTAAHHAAAQGHLWMLHFLLEAQQRRNAAMAKEGDPVESTTLGGYSLQHRSVLHYACMSEYKPMVQYLLTGGFDANEADALGNTCMDLAKRRNLLWLEDLLSGKAKAADPPTHMRKTRGTVAVLHGSLLLAILATSYWLVWWLAVPLIFVILGKSLAAFRQPGHGHGHSHGAPKNLANLHPSKRNVKVATNVSLEHIEEGPTKEMSAKSKKVKDETSVGLHTLIRPQPETAMGIWMAWVGLFTLLYIVLWVDSDYQDFRDSHTVFLGITGGAEVVFLVVWVRLAFFCPTDPGTIQTYEQDVKTMLEKVSRCETPDMTKFCRTCLVIKPIRSKHCAQCGICIARHDHHCAWINRCVGYGNHRSFFAFLLLHCLVLGIYAALAILVLSDATRDLHTKRVKSDGSGNSDSLSAMDVWIEIPSLVKKHLVVIMVLVWDLMAFVALAMMVNQHVNNIEQNLTINEQMNWRRYAYMTQKPASESKDGKNGKKTEVGAMFNPFDRGFKTNVVEFFSRSGSSAVDYRKVFTVPSSRVGVSKSATSTTVEMSTTSEDIEEKDNAGDVV
ncbi:palmitoyltransferase, putative [Phytophthora infestans T30-4]|uniref:Palmitoyltransferase n=1 Tax=Phytophthora infestans (strain T30-4) TaxID=403677 RepID=D0NUM2_PHYIT|nr:palmitoyltransferase, putative [Phytophthora infestans T30-4]EEY65368.1 palmitoyltransferase, putative [Phytophthora infestans T30-4]|eukprot:XP_002897231.1 palmitoyltransferase, putative [Phytophthora infestans T30-4]